MVPDGGASRANNTLVRTWLALVRVLRSMMFLCLGWVMYTLLKDIRADGNQIGTIRGFYFNDHDGTFLILLDCFIRKA
ncbi:hypothetical protein CUU62_23605 [Pseudomonas sp. WP001]|nr:hypothetical protein CUU62_23605 [Pseudomonas sp. WP001]